MPRLPATSRDTRYLLDFDAATEVSRISAALRGAVTDILRRRGIVVTMNGGVESAVCAALAVSAVGAACVFGLLLPERESSSSGLLVAVRWAEQLGIPYEVQDITSLLEVFSSYRHRNEAIRRSIPGFAAGWRVSRVLSPERGDADPAEPSTLLVVDPAGVEHRASVSTADYRQVAAALRLKQRTRAVLEYYHADRLQYAVAGTAGRLEHELGLSLKGGDGLSDVAPIAHLYQAQVVQLGWALGVAPAILDRSTVSGVQTRAPQAEDWPLSLPRDAMDALLEARNHGLDPASTAGLLGLRLEQVELAFAEIERLSASAARVYSQPLLLDGDMPDSTHSASSHD